MLSDSPYKTEFQGIILPDFIFKYFQFIYIIAVVTITLKFNNQDSYVIITSLMYQNKDQLEVQPAQFKGQSLSSKHILYFLFINTKSGDKQGLKYCELLSNKIAYIFKDKSKATIQLFDMFDTQRTKLGFQHAKKMSQLQNEGKKTYDVRLIICGGDGTIPWILSSAMAVGINFQNISIGIIPIGTGNDFSRSVGWGYKTTMFDSKNLSSLHKLVSFWNKAKIGYYDIWQIQISTFQGGAFYQTKNQKQIKIQQKILTKNFTNYFGIGLDARVVYTVEKSRGSNSFINKILYTLVGARNFFKSMENIDQIIQQFKQTKQRKISEQLSQQQILTKTSDCNQKQAMNNLEVEKCGEQKVFKLKNGYKGLVCLNCTSYMCGLRNVWMTNKSTQQDFNIKNNKQRQKFDDGKLQFIAFNNEITLALQRIMRTGVRVSQGEGPFQIKFKQNRRTDSRNVSTTYMQIDGQSLKIQNIKQINVKKSRSYPYGRINVLINQKQ